MKRSLTVGRSDGMWRVVHLSVKCFVLSSALATSAFAQSSTISPFDGHGIARAADPDLQHAAEVAAQRLASPCLRFFQVPGGGTGWETAVCEGASKELSRLGKDAANAVLEEIDASAERLRRSAFTPMALPFDALLAKLATMEREDLVPVLITALERLERRPRKPNDSWDFVDDMFAVNVTRALFDLTLAPKYDGSNGETGLSEYFRQWWSEHGDESRKEWIERAITRLREQLESDDGYVVLEALHVLGTIPKARAEAVYRAKRILIEKKCADEGCQGERLFLQSMEPFGRWYVEGE